MLKKILIFFNGKETISLLNYFFLLNENKIIFWKDDFGFKKKIIRSPSLLGGKNYHIFVITFFTTII